MDRRKSLLLTGLVAAIGALVGGCSAALSEPSAPARPAVTPLDHLPVLAGDYFAIDSRATRHSYHVFIRYPEGYAERPGESFPILYLLDGDSLFPHLAANQLFLHYDDSLPDILVVGIAYGSFDPPQNRRRHDFTAGARAFDDFLARELIPAVEGRVRANPDRRILFGQSRGGGYVLHSAFTNPDLFWGRIASNPTLDLLPSLAGQPSPARREDLHLLVASGSGDERYGPPVRDWFKTWGDREDLPWTLRTEVIAKGTHAADSARVHRLAMRWLFGHRDR